MKIASLRERTAKSTLAFRIVCYNERERTKAAKLFFYADFTQNTHNCELSIYDEIKKNIYCSTFFFLSPVSFPIQCVSDRTFFFFLLLPFGSAFFRNFLLTLFHCGCKSISFSLAHIFEYHLRTQQNTIECKRMCILREAAI